MQCTSVSAANPPGERFMGGDRDVGGCSVVNSDAPFPPSSSSSSFSSILPPFSLPQSSALAQDHINIPLKPVSTAARSPCPPLPLSLFLSLFLFFAFQPSSFLFIFTAIVFWKGLLCSREGQFYYLQSGVPPLAHMRAHTHACTRTHTLRGGGYRCL